MTCPHKYTGRNPSVVYPVWRTLGETAALYYVDGNTSGLNACWQRMADNARKNDTPMPFGVVVDVKSADWPRAEVETLMEQAGRAVKALKSSGMRYSAMKLDDAIDALKGKMG